MKRCAAQKRNNYLELHINAEAAELCSVEGVRREIPVKNAEVLSGLFILHPTANIRKRMKCYLAQCVHYFSYISVSKFWYNQSLVTDAPPLKRTKSEQQYYGFRMFTKTTPVCLPNGDLESGHETWMAGAV
jgi:hypothetical protein